MLQVPHVSLLLASLLLVSLLPEKPRKIGAEVMLQVPHVSLLLASLLLVSLLPEKPRKIGAEVMLQVPHAPLARRPTQHRRAQQPRRIWGTFSKVSTCVY